MNQLNSSDAKKGILPRQELFDLIDKGLITGSSNIRELVQPSSMDVVLGSRGFALKSGFIPRVNEPDLEEFIKRCSSYPIEIPSDRDFVLDKDRFYLVEIQGEFNLPKGYSGEFNPKSSTGRSDTMTRILVEGVNSFDYLIPGKRKAFVEINPLSFNDIIRKGTALNQLRIGYGEILSGDCNIDEAEMRALIKSTPIVFNPDGSPIPENEVKIDHDRIIGTVDLSSREIVGYRARNNSQIDYNLAGGRGCMAEQVEEFWEPIKRPKDGVLILEADAFYILETKERFSFPQNTCGVLAPQDARYGEGRIHYAGFFDTGFGYIEGDKMINGTSATLEVRMYKKPFAIYDGQPICLMRYQHMRDVPADEQGNPHLYGGAIKSNYQGQRGPTLGKQFLAPN